MVDSVNVSEMTSSALESALEGKLRESLESVGWLTEIQISRNSADCDRAFDILGEFRVPNGPRIELWVECKRDPRPAMFPYTSLEREFENKQVDRVKVPVFAAPYISPRMAEVCEKHGWEWFDLAGNCHISIPGVLHLERKGQPPVHKRSAPSVNLETMEAARIIRCLVDPALAGTHWTQRELGSRCVPPVSLGLVNKVVAHLREEALLDKAAGRGFTVTDPPKLLQIWRDAYRFDQHRREGWFTLLSSGRLRAALMELDSEPVGDIAYAAFSAAEYQAPHVRQPRTWLYVSQTLLPRFSERLEAQSVDSGENLVVLIPRDEGVFYEADAADTEIGRPACTNPVQTYVDLWHCGGRGREAAEALWEQRLVKEWRLRGVHA